MRDARDNLIRIASATGKGGETERYNVEIERGGSHRTFTDSNDMDSE
jgi:hypothetical protein